MRKLSLALSLAVAFQFSTALAQNYTASPGTGLTFGAKSITSVLYPQFLMCDPTTPSQCVAVNASGQITALAAQNGTWNINNISGTISLPTGAATAAGLTTINTTLGSPFQAGGSIGNTSFAATQATASNLNATVVGTGTFAVQAAQSGTWNVGGLGIAGTPSGGVVSVQGVSGGTALPISGTVAFSNSSIAVTNAGTFAAQLTGSTNNINNISGTISLPTGAATSAKQPALGTAGTASTDVLTVQGIASMTPLLATLSGTNNINNISGTVSLPTGAATATNQTGGGQKTQIVDGSGNVIGSTTNALNVNVINAGSGGTASTFGATFPTLGTAAGMSQGGNMVALTGTSGNLNVQCANCSGSGASGTDEGTFTAGTSVFAPGGGFFQTTATSNPLTNGQWGAWQMTANRAGFVNLRNASGTEIGTSTTPVQVSLANTATNATAVKVDGSAVTQPVSAASLPLPTGAATSANQPTNAAQGSTTSGQTGTLTQCAVTTSAPSYTTAQTDPFSCDTAGNLRVSVSSAVGLAQGSTTSGQTGSLIMGAVTTSPPSYTTGQTSPVSLDTSGNTRVVDAADGSTGSAVPGRASYLGAVSSGNLTGLIQADASVAINVSTATTTQLVALTSGQKIYVTALDVVAGGTGNITFEYGTGSNCGTGTTALTGAYNLTAQSGLTKGGGLGPVLVVPAGNALCVLTSAAVQMSGSVAYTKF